MLSPVEQEKVVQDNRFAFELFRQSTEALPINENALLSPLSIGTALAMVNNGARGETREEINKTLKWEGFDVETINNYYKKLVHDLPLLDPKTTLHTANSIWHHQRLSVLPDFLSINKQFYMAEVAALDFTDPSAPADINEWVNAKTSGKIPTIVDVIPANMMMYLINAIYFKGSWEQQFDPSETATGTFRKEANNSVQTDFMNITHKFKVSSDEYAEAIELPYGNRKYSMVIAKPKDGSTPAQLLEKYKEEGWQSLVSKFGTADVNLSMPKFKFSYEKQLKNDLTALGMDLAFSEMADFLGISTAQKLAISEVKHKSFIEVNEEGTEAAAVTSVGMIATSMPQVYTFTVDRPFLFVIREMNTGLILFVGQVNDPLAQEAGG